MVQLRQRDKNVSRSCLRMWLSYLLLASYLQHADVTAVQDTTTELFLAAHYADGLDTPPNALQLMATLVTGKGVGCIIQQAPALNTTESAAMVPRLPMLPAAAKCIGKLPAGLWTLQAARVAGTNWATWSCYSAADAADSDAAEAATVPGVASMHSSQAIVLLPGKSYLCVATYTRQSAEVMAAIATISWPAAVAAAASPVSTSADASATCQSPVYKQPPRAKPAAPLDVSGHNIINRQTGKPVTIHGINWFGFNVEMGMVDGLWAGGKDVATDFSKIAHELSLLGYNAVRLPFAHSYLAKTSISNLVRNCSTTGWAQFKQRVVHPHDWTAAVRRTTLPQHPAPLRNNPAYQCNTYLPMRNNQDRLLFVLQQFIGVGMYVVLDYQPQGLEQQAYNLNTFVDSWVALWRHVTCLPNFSTDIASRVLIDVMNEPDSMGIRWEASGDRPGAEQLYLATADALWKVSPDKMLFIFEGTGQTSYGLNWGNGFITDTDIINSRGLSNPNSFFQQLVKKPYAKKTIISPHLYPPSITKSTWLGEQLWEQSNITFNYLQDRGYCVSGSCIVFPIVVGETGSAYTEQDDKRWLKDFADFANARGEAAAFTKYPVDGWLWWAYNENSGDTGGIVMNNWQEINWGKMRYMMDSLGLTPWYKQRTSRPRRSSSNSSQSVSDVGGVPQRQRHTSDRTSRHTRHEISIRSLQ